MKKLLKNYVSLTKEQVKNKKNYLLFESIYFILNIILILIFNFNKPSTLTIYYLFPLALIVLAFLNLIFISKKKEIALPSYLLYSFEGILYLLIVIYLLFNPLTNKFDFMFIFALFMIIRCLLVVLKNKKLAIISYIYLGLLVIINGLCLIFNKYVINNLYLYLLIFYLILSIKILIITLVFSKKTNKKRS